MPESSDVIGAFGLLRIISNLIREKDKVRVESIYFDKPGAENTDETLRIARSRAGELGIKTVVVASTVGDTGVKATDVFKGHRVVVVTHCTGMKAPNTQELSSENRAKIEENGGIILTSIHTFGGLGKAVRRKLHTYQLEELIAYTLRTMGEGMKVVYEISTMAADAGLVRSDEEMIAIAGTGRGADTAVVLKPANAQDFFDIRVKEILCKPRL